MVLQLDFSSQTPIYLQIRNQYVVGIATGQLMPGEKLPTIRALAEAIGVNAMTVNKAYGLLKQEGYILADRRSGAVVNSVPRPAVISPETKEQLRLQIAQMKLAGISLAELQQLCKILYEETESVL